MKENEKFKTHHIGLGKTIFKSSLALIDDHGDTEIILNERVTRKKNDGAWPFKTLSPLKKTPFLSLTENRDVRDPLDHEIAMNKGYPFFELLEKKGLTQFSRNFNPEITFLSHHAAHAYSVLNISPFDEALIVVFDGAGSQRKCLNDIDEEFHSSNDEYEAISVYLQNAGELKTIKKVFQRFHQSQKVEHTWSNHIGLFYEKISEFIFGSKTAAGKVMGLAPLGKALPVNSYEDFLEGLDWSEQAYQNKDSKEWDQSPHFNYYCDLAATAQKEFESVYFNLLETLKGKFPHIKNIILTGGCALNCTANGKLLERKWFDHIYVSPFPGDESIGHGCASYAYLKKNSWKRKHKENQHSYFGQYSSVPSPKKVEETFSSAQYQIRNLRGDYQLLAEILARGEVIAWFSGRSECGPRALGHRSFLAYPKVGIKNYLNEHIKFRESFRPYGCSVPLDSASSYFQIEDDFENPFMSFAVKAREEFREILKEVCHIDGTSRMQTVRESINPEFYQLLKAVEAKTGNPILLNTSLNIMGEPIVETIDDAKNLLDQSRIRYLFIEDFLVTKNG